MIGSNHTVHETAELAHATALGVADQDRAFAEASPDWVQKDARAFAAYSDRQQAMHAAWDDAKAKADTAATLAGLPSGVGVVGYVLSLGATGSADNADNVSSEEAYQAVLAVRRTLTALARDIRAAGYAFVSTPAPTPTAPDANMNVLNAADAGTAGVLSAVGLDPAKPPSIPGISTPLPRWAKIGAVAVAGTLLVTLALGALKR